MAFQSGKLAKIRIGAVPTTFKSKKWTATYKVQKLETTNSESAGAGEYIGGIADLDVTIEGDYDVGGDPITTLLPGTSISTVKLFLNDTTGVFWLIPTMYVESFETGAEVRGLVSIKITGCGTGAVTKPVS